MTSVSRRSPAGARAPGRRDRPSWRILPLVALLSVTIVLGGCDGPGSAADAPEGATPVPVGLLVAVTGSGSFYGEVMREGAELAAEDIRRNGGVGGYTFDVRVEDHESGDPDVAISAGRKLIHLDGTPVILGSFTAPTVAVRALGVDQGVLVLNGGGVGSDLVGKRGLYNTRSLGEQLVPGLVRWALEEHGARRIATIHWNDAAGRAVARTVRETCESADCEVVAEEPHEVGATSFGPQLARIRAADPELLVVGSYGNDVGHIVVQARRQGLDVPVVGNEWTPDAQTIGGGAMEGYVAVLDRFSPEESGDPDARELVERYREAYGEAPEFYAANYYELVRFVLADLVRMALEAGDDPAERGALLEAMERAVERGHRFETVYGESMTFNPDGTIEKPAGVYEVRDGELQRLGALEEGEVVEDRGAR